MRVFKRIVFIVLLLLVLAMTSLWAYVQYYGKDHFLRALKVVFKTEVSVGDIEYKFPFGLRITGIAVKDVIEAPEIIAWFKWRAILDKKVHISHLTVKHPTIRLYKSKPYNPEDPLLTVSTLPTEDKAGQSSSDEDKSVLRIDQLILDGGDLFYTRVYPDKDRTMSFHIEDMQLSAEDIAVPRCPEPTLFRFNGVLSMDSDKMPGQKINGGGWINFLAKDMEAGFTITGPDGDENLICLLSAENNILEVSGTANVESFRSPGETVESDQRLIAGTMQTLNIDIESNYVIRTRLDDFEIREIAISGAVVRKTVAP